MQDILVIGGGPAGVTAALRASELGARVTLIERDRMGGTCTNDGCVPTRVLAKAARLIRDAEQFDDYGLVGERPQLDFERLLHRTQQVVYGVQEKKQLIKYLQEHGVKVFANVGAARFKDAHTVALPDGTDLKGEKIILCVGGHPRRLAFPGAENAYTHSEVWSMKALPASMTVVGAAATGCQLASVFAAFGTRVAMLELAPRILSGEDESVSKAMQAAFEDREIQVITAIDGVDRIDKQGQNLSIHYQKDGESRRQSSQAVVLAVGWPGNIDGLNLPAAGVETERGYVSVDDYLRTSAPHIFAAGDITGRMMLVQSGGYEARIAAENAVLKSEQKYEHQIVPHGGFTDPEYGSVGLTENEARSRGLDIAVATVPYTHLDRAVIDGRPEGLGKLIVSRDTHRLLGAHVVGEQALEIVQIVAAGMAADMWVEQLAELEIAYPTFTAILGLAARRLLRDLGVVPLADQWRTLGRPHTVEWERRDA
jgi:dihydrolipoamide dehydrogenase